MSKVECTAVNELVDLVQTKALAPDDADVDLFATSSPRAARLRGTPAPSLFEMPAPPPAPAPSPISAVSLPMRPNAQPMRAHRPAVRLGSPDTSHVGSYVPLSTLGRRAALPVAGLVGLGIIAGIAYTRLGHHDATSGAQSVADITLAAAAAVPPAPAPIVAPVAAEPAAPKFVDVRLDSTPAGATVTLISNGITSPLGPTPLDTSLDPSKSYSVVFAMDGKPSKVENLDPNTTQHVEVSFEDAAPAVAAAPAPAVKSSHHKGKHARVATAAPASSPRHSNSKMPKLATVDFGDAPSPKAAKAADAGTGDGTLAVITSAPAAILIDDKNTGLTAPQRSISVPAGHHNVRIIAATQHINKLVPVDISAHHTTSIKPF
jgi:hypothetical protein